MSSPRYITRPVVEHDVEDYSVIRHLLDRLFIFISEEDRDKIEQDLDAIAIKQDLPLHTMVAFMRITIYADVKDSEVTSSDTSTTPPGDTVGPVDFEPVD